MTLRCSSNLSLFVRFMDRRYFRVWLLTLLVTLLPGAADSSSLDVSADTHPQVVPFENLNAASNAASRLVEVNVTLTEPAVRLRSPHDIKCMSLSYLGDSSFSSSRDVCLITNNAFRVMALFADNSTLLPFAGSGRFSFNDGIGTAASFRIPYGLGIVEGNRVSGSSDRNTYAFVADQASHCLRRLGLRDARVVTIVGQCGTHSSAKGGVGTEASIPHPTNIWPQYSPVGVSLLVTCQFGHGHCIFLISVRTLADDVGTAAIVAGACGEGRTVDGPVLSGARFHTPHGITSILNGSVIYVTESVDGWVRRIKEGVVSTMFGLQLGVVGQVYTYATSVDLAFVLSSESKNSTEGVSTEGGVSRLSLSDPGMQQVYFALVGLTGLSVLPNGTAMLISISGTLYKSSGIELPTLLTGATRPTTGAAYDPDLSLPAAQTPVSITVGGDTITLPWRDIKCVSLALFGGESFNPRRDVCIISTYVHARSGGRINAYFPDNSTISWIAGNGTLGFSGGVGRAAALGWPFGLAAVDTSRLSGTSAGREYVYVAENYGHCVYRLSLSDFDIVSVVGHCGIRSTAHGGVGSAASLPVPTRMWPVYTPTNVSLIVPSTSTVGGCILLVTFVPQSFDVGNATVVAGRCGLLATIDGRVLRGAQFTQPSEVAAAADGSTVYVMEMAGRLRRIASGMVTSGGYFSDGGAVYFGEGALVVNTATSLLRVAAASLMGEYTLVRSASPVAALSTGSSGAAYFAASCDNCVYNMPRGALPREVVHSLARTGIIPALDFLFSKKKKNTKLNAHYEKLLFLPSPEP